MDRSFSVVVEVTALVDESLIDDDDTGVAGTYGFAFLDSEAEALDSEKLGMGYEPDDRIVEHALDLFHDTIAIENLDDFGIVAIRVEPGSRPDVDFHASASLMSSERDLLHGA